MVLCFCTIKGGSRRAEKSRKVLMMMMKAAKLGWAGPGAGQEQGRNRAGAELRIVKQSREERGQELGRNWGEARNVQDRSLQGARQEYGRGGAEAGAGEEQRERGRGRDDDDDNDDNEDDDDEDHHYQEREIERET